MLVKVYDDRELHGRRLPWYYGTAWYRPYSNQTVVIIIPFNRIAALLRLVYWWFKHVPPDAIAKAYQDGRADGIRYMAGYYLDSYKRDYERSDPSSNRRIQV